MGRGRMLLMGNIGQQLDIGEMQSALPVTTFRTRSAQVAVFSLTPCFSWVLRRNKAANRFNGLPRAAETVETVAAALDPLFTQLKQGVNERVCIRRLNGCDSAVERKQ